MSDLPFDIITTILVCLPVKSLLRFRCVSKPWRSLIDGRYFTKLHLRQSSETNTDRTLILQTNRPLTIPYDLDSLDTGNIGFPNSVSVKGSCNGLVLLANTSISEKLFLWNPSTRKLNVLHAPPPPKSGYNRYGRYGLGYDSKHADYKVVCVDPVSYKRLMWIYSLKTNSWKKTDVGFPYNNRIFIPWGVCVNGAMHFVVNRSASGAEEIIMAFDLAKEEYNEIPKPECAAGRVGCSLGSVGGRLVVVVDKREVWVMSEYGVKGSWCKLTNCFDGVTSLRLLAYSEGGVEGLFHCYHGRTRWCCLGNNNKDFTFAHVEGSSGFLDVDVVLGSAFDAWVCVASLVSPFSPYEVGVKEE